MITQPKKATNRRKPSTLSKKTPPVYFLSLEVEDVLCFKDRQFLDLSDRKDKPKPAQWTVILGNNGVGKTTLLRCLAGMEVKLDWVDDEETLWACPLLFKDSDMWQESEILEANMATIHSFVVSGNPLSSISTFENLESQIHDIEVTMGDSCISGGEELKGLICYGYGATRRMSQTSLSENYFSEHSASLFSDNATLINAEEWLLQTDYAVKSASGKMRTRLKKQLNHIIEILKRILPDIENVRIIPTSEEQDFPRAEFFTPYGWVRLSSLGLGYRTTISWIVDLAVRLFKRYPDSEDPLAETAIVLVDEIDLHMHPTWQRTIMEFLTERFPNTQFIVTAHSPLVVQAAQNANIVLLRREGDRVVIDNDPEIIENWRVDQVLTSVFEMPSARPAKIEPWLKRRKEILTQANISEDDQAELDRLEEQIGAIPTAEDVEDIKAMDIIRRAAKLLEKSVTEKVE